MLRSEVGEDWREIEAGILKLPALVGYNQLVGRSYQAKERVNLLRDSASRTELEGQFSRRRLLLIFSSIIIILNGRHLCALICTHSLPLTNKLAQTVSSLGRPAEPASDLASLLMHSLRLSDSQTFGALTLLLYRITYLWCVCVCVCDESKMI